MYSFTFVCAVIVFCILTPFCYRKQLANCQSDLLKKGLAEQEGAVLNKIGKGDNIVRDEVEGGGSLQGVLDDDDGDQIEGIDEDVILDGDDYNIRMDTFLVQKLHKEPAKTTYHTFYDSTFKYPLFARSEEEYQVDFIIFANPSFPTGTGHYVVLRRLEAPSEPEMYEIDDDLNADDEDEYEGEVMDKQDQEGDDIPIHQLAQVSPTDDVQSGEENYVDNIEMVESEREGLDDVGKSADNGEGDDDYDSQLEPRLSFQLKIKHRPSESVLDSDYDTTGETETIYEAFSLNFRDSIHGFISDMDPLQYSFMNNNNNDVELEKLMDEGNYDSDSAENDPSLDGLDDDAEFDSDFQNFQNSIKNDAGMMDSDSDENDDEADTASPASFFHLPETRRKKRAVNVSAWKTVAITSRVKKSGSVKWKGCLHSLNINEFIWRKRNQS